MVTFAGMKDTMNMSIIWVVLIVLGAFCQTVLAVSSNFIASPELGDEDWTNAVNWDNGVPNSRTDAGIANSVRIGAATSAATNRLRVGWGSLAEYSPTGLLTVEGDLTVHHSIVLGSDGDGANGTMVVEAGATVDNLSMASSGKFSVGANGIAELFVSGTIKSDSMEITNWESFGSIGTVHVLPGGVVDLAGRLTVDFGFGTGSLIISPGGSLSTGENWGGWLDTWELSGAIRAMPGASLVVTNHAMNSGRTYTAVGFVESDFNEDGDVDGADFLAWQRGTEYPGYAYKSEGDANNDYFIDGLDLEIWKIQFGGETGIVTVVTPVPETATGLLAIGALVTTIGCGFRPRSCLGI